MSTPAIRPILSQPSSPKISCVPMHQSVGRGGQLTPLATDHGRVALGEQAAASRLD